MRRQTLVPRQRLSTRKLHWPSSIAAAGGGRLENRALVDIDEEKSTSGESKAHPSVTVMQIATDNSSSAGLHNLPDTSGTWSTEGDAENAIEVDATIGNPLEAGLANERKSKMNRGFDSLDSKSDEATSTAKPWFLSWFSRSKTSWEGFDLSGLAGQDPKAATSGLECGTQALSSESADVSRCEEKGDNPEIRFM